MDSSPYNQRLNALIIKVFNNGKFIDTSTFLLRVLFRVQKFYLLWSNTNSVPMGKDLLCYSHQLQSSQLSQLKSSEKANKIMIWCHHVYCAYFQAYSIPRFYSMIRFAVDASDHPKELFKKVLKNSQLYLEQKHQNKLNYLSQMLDEWMSSDNVFGSAEAVHLKYLVQFIDRFYVSDICYTNGNVSELYERYEYLMKAINFLKKNHNQFCRITDLLTGPYHLLELVLQTVIYNDRGGALVNDVRIGRLCRILQQDTDRTYKKMAYKIVQRCTLLGYYYFYCRYQFAEGIKCMYKGMKIFHRIKNRTKCSWITSHHLDAFCMMLYISGNFSQCEEVNEQLKLFLAQNNLPKQERYDMFLKKGRKTDMFLTQNIKERLETMLKNIYNKNCDYKIQKWNKGIIQYITDDICHNILKNAFRLRQCNYVKCNRKDLKSFKMCKRCKIAFYCTKKHQKLDWNTKHRKYCVAMRERHANVFFIENIDVEV
eukprot:523971_1